MIRMRVWCSRNVSICVTVAVRLVTYGVSPMSASRGATAATTTTAERRQCAKTSRGHCVLPACLEPTTKEPRQRGRPVSTRTWRPNSRPYLTRYLAFAFSNLNSVKKFLQLSRISARTLPTYSNIGAANVFVLFFVLISFVIITSLVTSVIYCGLWLKLALNIIL